MKIETQRERELVNYWLDRFASVNNMEEIRLNVFKEYYKLNEPKETIKEFQEWLENMTKQFHKKFIK